MKAIKLLILLLAFSQQVFSQVNTPTHSLTDKKPIKILSNNWTSQIVLSRISGKIFSSLGYPIIYKNSDFYDQWGALTHGSADIQLEVWEGTMSDQYHRLIKNGAVVDAGSHQALTREDWWYPSYVEELCPGLPDWKALKDCSNLFSRPDSNGSGVYFAGPWEKPDEARVRALELDFIVRVLNTSDEIWQELEAAYKNRQPIMIHNWTPNWIEAHHSGKFIEFPKHHPNCEIDPSWGVNKHFLYDCGNQKNGWLKKIARSEFATSDTCAFNTLKNISFTNQQISQVTALVDVDGFSYDKAAHHWLTQNSDLWKSWIAKECLK